MKLLTRAISVTVMAVILSLSLSSKSQAQYENALSINPLSLVFNLHMLQAQYEFSTGTSNSLAIRGEYVSDVIGYSATGLGGSYRFFLTNDRPLAGFAIAPALDLFFFSNSATTRSATVYSFGADASYQWFFSHFALQPQFNLRIGGGGDGVPAYVGTYWYFSLFAGYAW